MRRSIATVSSLTAGVLGAILVLAAGGFLVWTSIRQTRNDAMASVAATVAAATTALREGAAPQPVLDAAIQSPFVATAKLYARDGQNLASAGSAVATQEIECNSVSLKGKPATLCVETTLAPLSARERRAITTLAGATLAALLLGLLAGRFLAKSFNAPLVRLADLIERAHREHNWSVRAAAASGDLGRLSSAVNELLTDMHEREIETRRRTAEVEAMNKELESFAYTVSHDLRAPLGSIDGFTQAIETDYAHLMDDTGREYLGWVREGCRQMRELIDGLLQMSRLTRHDMQLAPVDLSAIAHDVAGTLQQASPNRNVKFSIRDGVKTVGDERLLRAVVENLMSNAFKFTRERPEAHIEFGVANDNGHHAYYVRDNGAGFDPSHAAKMFRPFQRLHSAREFEGTGIGLATVQKIIERHGGRAWAEGEVGKGATIYFTTADRPAA